MLDQAPQSPEDKPRTAIMIVCATVLALAALGIYAWQSATGRDTSTTLTLVMLTLAAAIPGVASYSRVNSVHRDVGTVRQQTNGTVTTLLAMLADAQARLANSSPPRVPAEGDPPAGRADNAEEPADHP